MKMKNYLFICFCTLMCLMGCTKIHHHSAKDPYPEKKPRKERVYFTYGTQSKKASVSGDMCERLATTVNVLSSRSRGNLFPCFTIESIL